MKAKKLISLLLCVLLMATLAIPAFAEKQTVSSFTDTKGHWAEHAINLVADEGIVNGVGNGMFAPNAVMTREQFAKVIAVFMGYTEMADISNYADIKPNDSLAPYLAMCVKQGVLTGYDATHIGPYDPLTREQAATMLARAFKLNTKGLVPQFTDSNSIGSWFKESVAALELTGLIQGTGGGNFSPQLKLDRAQMMTIISRLLPDNSGYFAKVSLNSGAVAMTFDMLDDYTSKMFIPAGTVTAPQIDLDIRIESIPVLGIEVSSLGITHIQDTVSTGLTDNEFNPKELFPSVFDFNFATLKLSVNNKLCTYNIYGKAADEGTTMTITPTKSNDANEGMKELMNLSNLGINFFISGNSITLANGSYLQIGKEKICFPEGSSNDLVIDLGATDAEVTDLVFSSLTTLTDVPSDGHQATLVIKQGTAYTTDSCRIKFNKDLIITFDGLDLSDTGVDGDHLITTLESADLSNLQMLVELGNSLVEAMDGNVAYINITLSK